jgi:hypothetical protein
LSAPGPIRAWNRAWFAPVSARPLGAFRIVFGLIVLAHLALLAPESDEWLSDAGRLRGTEARELAGPLRPSFLQYVQDPAAVRLTLTAAAASAVAFTLGWHTRTAGVVLYGLLLSIQQRNLLTASGADSMLMIVMFLLMLSPSGAACSLDARRLSRRRGTPADALILPWAQRLIQVQLAFVYLATTLIKLTGTTWSDGTALHYVLGNAEFRRWTFGLTGSPELINLLTYSALAIELALPFLIWFRATRPWICLAGLALHGGILLTVNIPLFGELMTACYLLFLTPEELNALLARLDPRRPFRRRRPPATIRGRVDLPASPRPHATVPSRQKACADAEG